MGWVGGCNPDVFIMHELPPMSRILSYNYLPSHKCTVTPHFNTARHWIWRSHYAAFDIFLTNRFGVLEPSHIADLCVLKRHAAIAKWRRKINKIKLKQSSGYWLLLDMRYCSQLLLPCYANIRITMAEFADSWCPVLTVMIMAVSMEYHEFSSANLRFPNQIYFGPLSETCDLSKVLVYSMKTASNSGIKPECSLALLVLLITWS